MEKTVIPTVLSIEEIRDVLTGGEAFHYYDSEKVFRPLGEYVTYLFKKESNKWEKVCFNYDNPRSFHMYDAPSFRLYFGNVIGLCLDGVKYSISNDDSIHFIKRKALCAYPCNHLICDNLGVGNDSWKTCDNIQNLDFGEFSIFRDLLLNDIEMGTKVYCNCSDKPIKGVLIIRDKAKFHNYSLLCDRYYSHYLQESANHPNANFGYEEIVYNLDFEGCDDSPLIWTRVVDNLCDELVYKDARSKHYHRYIIDENRNVLLWGEYQDGIELYSLIFPRSFLNYLQKSILPIYEVKERERIKQRKIQQQKQEQESLRRKAEEERKRDFNLKNKHYRDANISLRDTHYYLQSSKLLGITSVVNNFFPQFDADYWAEIKAPLLGKSKEQLLEEWEHKRIESAHAGTKLHHKIDDYYHQKIVQTDDKDYLLFKQFADAYKLNPYRSEWAIYDEDSNIVGVVDMLDYSDGEYILYDWKRSEKIIEGGQPITKNKFDEYGLKPIENVPNTDYWHYALQLSFYRYILEKNYGIRIKESRLVVLHPNLNLPIVLTTPYMIDEVNKIIAVMKM